MQCNLFTSMPDGIFHLNRFTEFVKEGVAFRFIRFSDGELEVIRNRKLIIKSGVTQFRGRISSNNFPRFDDKTFDPDQNKIIRKDLLASAVFCDSNYFKGIPTAHNNALDDRELMLRLNGGFSEFITFADLFLNSNFTQARSVFFPILFREFKNKFVVGNFRCKLKGELGDATLIPVPDNFFTTYEETLSKTLNTLKDIPSNSLVLSSASSLTNILGHAIQIDRQDITFIDIGTVLNDLLGLPLNTRVYHKLLNPVSVADKLSALLYRFKSEYKITW